MNVTVDEPTPGDVRISPRGYIDLDTVRGLRSTIEKVTLTPGGTLVLDLSDVEFMDSAGLTFLVWLRRHVVAADSVLEVVGTRPPVAKVLRLTGIDLFLGTSRGPGRATQASSRVS